MGKWFMAIAMAIFLGILAFLPSNDVSSEGITENRVLEVRKADVAWKYGSSVVLFRIVDDEEGVTCYTSPDEGYLWCKEGAE